MRNKPPLLKALESLKETIQSGENADTAFDVCLGVENTVRYAHVLYREIGELALTQERWCLAEQFAIRALKAAPGYGAAFRLTGMSLRGQERFREASLCHRYQLPNSLRRKYFHDVNVTEIPSQQAGDTVSIREAFPASTMAMRLPITIDSKPVPELSATELKAAPAKTFSLDSSHIWFDGFNTIVWDKQGRVIQDASRGYPDIVQSSMASRTPTHLEGTSCLLGNRNADNYYHWMNDIIPRLCVLEASGTELSSIDHFIINPLLKQFQIETLGMLGIAESRLVTIEPQPYFNCDNLLVPDYGSNTLGMGQGAWNPAYLKSVFLRSDAVQQERRLYITRDKANGRSVENETELTAFLTRKGFECVDPGEMSIGQQAETFNSASIIVSAHGAALSNIAFCQPGTRIVELYKDHIAPCFWIISEQTALVHSVLYCGDNTSPDEQFDSEQYHLTADKRRLSNFRIATDKLEQLLLTVDAG